jgi:hypothetical protein
MQVFALIDYDNVKPIKREKTSLDVEENITRIASQVSQEVRNTHPNTGDLYLRLYGGWTDRKSNFTMPCNWIFSTLPRLRTRLNGMRIHPDAVVTNFECRMQRYSGLYRDGGQKMVDTLIVADLLTLTSQYTCPVMLASDDEDMVPGLVACGRERSRLTLMRTKPLGEAMNDNIIRDLSIRVSGGVK